MSAVGRHNRLFTGRQLFVPPAHGVRLGVETLDVPDVDLGVEQFLAFWRDDVKNRLLQVKQGAVGGGEGGQVGPVGRVDGGAGGTGPSVVDRSGGGGGGGVVRCWTN